MRNSVFILLFMAFFLAFLVSSGQDQESSNSEYSFNFKGQWSTIAHYNNRNELPLWLSTRYIPQINYTIEDPESRMIDFEISANLFGNANIKPFSNFEVDGKAKPYRAWARYSTRQLEIRVGLQKINFGSATMLRPLMWFDQIDPRDPLRLTDGVWGILGRYYFLNNSNIWLWALYGNKNPRGWEYFNTAKNTPEFGGRLQTPVPKGELALSYHYRKIDQIISDDQITSIENYPENRVGLDFKLDLAVGIWFEGAWISNNKNKYIYKNQEILNAGIDYTFGIGSGLYVVFEQLFMSYDKKAFEFQNKTTFSTLSMSYPVGLFDNLSAIFYYNWDSHSSYNFFNWQKQFDKITLHLMAYWNPKNYQIPTQNNSQNIFAGKGIQFMFVYNH